MEVCVDSLESVVAAYQGSADRVELCSSLNEGGLTPSYGLVKSTLKYVENFENNGKKPMKVNCMIRSRVGDFCYSDNEIEMMKEDLKKFIEMNVDGIVFGALKPNGLIDEDLNKEFLDEIPSNSEIKTTFHRAFDVCSDWKDCFEKIEELGYNKILTSGQQKTAYEGKNLIKELVNLSNKKQRVEIIAGAGINSSNLLHILETNCHEFHSSCRNSKFSKMTFRNDEIKMGSPLIDEFEIKVTDKLKCQELADIYKKFLRKK